MRIVFSDHAKQRMEERDIEEKDVAWTLFSPDWYEPSGRHRIRLQKKIGNRTLEVIYLEENEIMIVVTCYWL